MGQMSYRHRGILRAQNAVEYRLNGAADYDYGQLTQLPDGFGDGEFTLELWVKCTGTQTGQTSSGAGIRENWANEDATKYTADWWFYGNFLIDGHNNGTFENGTFSIQVYGSGRVRWTFGDGAAAGARTGDLHGIQASVTGDAASILNGAWHKIACVRRWDGGSGSILELYVDGIQIGTETSTSRTNMATSYWDSWSGYPVNQDGWFFGAEKQAALGSLEWADFKGRIADVAFFNVARSSEELTTNYAQPTTGDESGCVGFYRHIEGSGATVADAKASGGNITLTNSPSTFWVSDSPY